ncbi:AMP-binding protein [Pseudomonas corrugata]
MHFIYNEAWFDAAQIETLQQRFMTALHCVVDDFEVPVNALDIMPPAERYRVVNEWNHTAVDYPREVLLHQLIEAQVAAHPEATAVRFEDQALTYDELNRRANQVAHALLETGIGPDARVAICLERSLEMVVGLLGILKAGGAYVPLDPGYPADRLRHMLSDSAPSALITTRTLLSNLPAVTMPMLCLDTDLEHLSRQPQHNPDPIALGLTPRHLAYVIYTSGSTGLPKGVMNQHDGVVNRLLWARDAYQVDEHSRVLQKPRSVSTCPSGSFSCRCSVARNWWSPPPAGIRTPATCWTSWRVPASPCCISCHRCCKCSSIRSRRNRCQN